MKKKHKKKNNKRKTKDTGIVSQTLSLSTSMPLPPMVDETLSEKLFSVGQSTSRTIVVANAMLEEDLGKVKEELSNREQGIYSPKQTNRNNSVKEGIMQDYLCKKIDDLAFSGPGNSLNKLDYHAWCIDEQGLVCDYEAKVLMSNVDKGTVDIVRRPFTAHSITEWLGMCDESYDEYLRGIVAVFGGGVENAKAFLLSIIETPLFPKKNCYVRAKLLYESDPKKYSLVIGSLGFRQTDGTIYWEYG